MLEQEKHIRELESRLAAVNRDNECLRAEVDEANHWVYERGPIKAELLDLRRNNIMSLAELNRLTSENAQKTVQLAAAEAHVRTFSKWKYRNAPQVSPPMRAATTQTRINNLWLISAEAARAQRGNQELELNSDTD